MDSYDLCVLGGGPGGLSAAIRGAQKGAKVCLIDPGPLGGTCLNRGCIPARALGTTARLMAQLAKSETIGIRCEGIRVEMGQVKARKDRILRRLRTALMDLVQRSQVTWLQGEGVLQRKDEVEVLGSGSRSTGLKAQALVLATGSRPSTLAGCPIDGEVVVTSDEILDLDRLPSSLVVIGAGVVGSEFASYFVDLGVSVTLVEATDRVLPAEDSRIAEAFAQSLKRRGVTILTGTKVKEVTREGQGQATVTLAGGERLRGGLILMAAGRQPQLPKGAEGVGLKLEKGGLPVDEQLKTSIPSIFGIGDLLGEYQLACTASYEGAVASENALGGSRRVDYSVVPDALYTEPEIASVGLTEQEARVQGTRVTVSRLSFAGFSRAQTLEETEGFVQVVAEQSTGRLVGVQILGARATDLIGEAALAIQHQLTLKDLVETLHGHPTMSESLWEAAAMALGQSIYYAAHE